MRTVYDTTGADVTSATKIFLAAQQQLYFVDLFTFQTWSFWPGGGGTVPVNFYFNAGTAPIKVGYMQTTTAAPVSLNATFVPVAIERDSMKFSVGLNTESVKITWFIDDTIAYFPGPPTFKQAFVIGYGEGNPIWIHRAIFTDSTYSTLLGTTLMWRGIVNDLEVSVDKLVITAKSLMDIIQQTQVPTQVIQLGNRGTPYIPPAAAVQIDQPRQSLSTPYDLVFSTNIGFPSDGSLAGGFLILNAPSTIPAWVPTSGATPPVMIRIRTNATFGGNLHIYPYEPFTGVMNQLGTLINCWAISPLTNVGGAAPGFPYIPKPETGF